MYNIRWPKKVYNEKAYEVTQVKPRSQTMKIRQMKWFGHVTRLPDNTPAKTTLKYEETLKTSRSTKGNLEKNDGKKSKLLQCELGL